MGPVKAVALKTFLGGRSVKEYGIIALILLGIVAFQVYDAHSRMSDALASGDLELVQIIRRSAALFPLTAALPMLAYISLAGVGVIESEFRNRTAVMVLTRIERSQFFVGSWIGLMLFVVSAYAFVLAVTGVLMWYYDFVPSSLLGLAILKQCSQTFMIYSIAFAFGAISQRPRLFFFIAYFLNAFAQNFSHFGALPRCILGMFYLCYPAQISEDLLQIAVTTSHTQFEYSLIAFVIAENLLYSGAILMLAFAIFRNREVMAR